MGREAATYRMMLTIGLLGIGVLMCVAWGLRQTLQPDPEQQVQTKRDASPFDASRAYADVEKLVAIGPRVAGTPGSQKAQDFITKSLKIARVPFEVHSFEADTPLGKRSMANIIAKVAGSTDEIILLGNHYDTKYLPDIDFVGANDSGSTTGWMLEMARILGAQRQGASVWLCFFDGEEAFEEWTETDSLYGSRALVDKLKSDGDLSRIKAVINVDMIGDCHLAIWRDPEAPPWLAQAIQENAQKFGYTHHFTGKSEVLLDDHIPFRLAGIPAINLIDFSYGGTSIDHRRNWHTSRDRMDLVCAASLQAVGDVIYHAILTIDRK